MGHFAVVADEVRSLAQRSARAAKETADKIADSSAKSLQGVHISTKVASSLAEIVKQSRRMDELVATIATASAEQSEGINQINKAVSHIDTITQKNSAGAQQGAESAEKLSSEAEALMGGVHQLLVLIGGTYQTGEQRQGEPGRTQSTFRRANQELESGSNHHGRNGSQTLHGISVQPAHAARAEKSNRIEFEAADL
jgi:methyl-accepting chemotaxis protein